jgi:threonine synthase
VAAGAVAIRRPPGRRHADPGDDRRHLSAARAEQAQGAGSAPIVALSTAHPAKFPDAVERATGIRPALPAGLAEIIDKPERTTVLPNDAGAVARYLRAQARRTSADRRNLVGVA